ncbi:MAG TPA: class I SAM-dependent methyltransferase [Solirubrobacterales bacterium]
MLPHWQTVIRPFLQALGRGPIIEIGADTGSTTTFLAEFAVEHDIVVHVVDPVPNFDVAEFERRFSGHFRFYREKSHDALEEIEPAAAVLIDGDHNWYTVHGELKRLERIARDSSQLFPMVMFHDVEWPYARRDMYYDPDGIPDHGRRPWSRSGIKWEQSELASEGEGIGEGLAKATEEGGPRNGVLTAIEDFARDSELSLELKIVPGSNGLGVLATRDLLDALPTLRTLWDGLLSPEFLLDHAKGLAKESMRIAVLYMEADRRLKQIEGERVESGYESGGPESSRRSQIQSKSEDRLVFHSTPGNPDTDTAIIAFSSRGAENGRFHFFELDRVAPAPAKLLVRDPSENWYNTGLPGVGDTIADIAARIEEKIAELRAKHILTIGSSMGGYAAILFGCMIEAERAIALVPQTLLDPGLPRRRPPHSVTLQAPDLKEVIAKTPNTKIEVVAAQNDILDVFHAQRIASFPSVRVLGLPGADHEFAEKLNEQGKYYPLIFDLIEGNTPAVGRYEPPFDEKTVAHLAEAVFARGREDAQAEQLALISVAKRYPSWTAPDLVAARSAVERPENTSGVS